MLFYLSGTRFPWSFGSSPLFLCVTLKGLTMDNFRERVNENVADTLKEQIGELLTPLFAHGRAPPWEDTVEFCRIFCRKWPREPRPINHDFSKYDSGEPEFSLLKNKKKCL